MEQSGLGKVLGVFFLLVLVTDLPGKVKHLFPFLCAHLGEPSTVCLQAWKIAPRGFFFFLILMFQSMMVEFSSSELLNLKGEGYEETSPGDLREEGYGAWEAESGGAGALGLEEPRSARAARGRSPQGQLCPGSSAHPSPHRYGWDRDGSRGMGLMVGGLNYPGRSQRLSGGPCEPRSGLWLPR